jgi:Tol biopolymer transport system component
VDGTLKRVPAEGGTPLHICRAANGKGGSWGRDDVLVIAPSSGTVLHRVPAAGGELVPLTRLALPYNSHRHPRFLPDGRRFLFLARAVRSAESAVFVGSLDGGEPRQVMRAPAQAEFAAGHLLFARESVLMAQPFDPASATLTGEARRIAEGVLELSGAAFSAFSASANGRLAFHAGASQAPVRIELRDRQGGALGAVGQPGTYRAPAFSPDGNWLAVTGFPGVDGNDNHDVWLLDLDGQGTLRFTVGPEEDIDATWAADGRSIFYGSNVEGPHDVLRKSLDGAGAAELVYEAPGLQTPTGVSRDGRFLLLESGQGERTAIEAVDLASGKIWKLREGPFEDARGRLSPDGRWLALVSDETGRPEVYVTPFPGPGRLWPVSTGGGRFPSWREDGREIVYTALDGRFVAVAVAAEGDSFRLGAATELFRSAPPTRDYQDWGMSADAQRFAIVPSGVLESDNELRLILDWPARIADR